MKMVEVGRKFASDDEYFLFEERSEIKHEFVNENLFVTSGVSIFHNDIVLNIFVWLKQLQKKISCKISVEAFKVRTPNGNFFYPDIAVFNESPHKYYTSAPVLIVEVLTESTSKFDFTDKFIQ